ncbi:MAG: hypothetical protein ABSD96_14515, partial [Candidatus Korobacteraceae bacterium]
MTEERSQSALFGAVSKELLAGGMGFRFQARGRSMAPSIWDGEIVHVQPVAAETLCKGDIVMFSDGTHFRIHRVVEVREGAVVTQGDAAAEPDGVVRFHQILGKAVAKEERFGKSTRLAKLGTAPCRNWAQSLLFGRVAASLASRVGKWRADVERRLFARTVLLCSKLLVLLFALAFTLPALGQVALDSASSTTGELTGYAPSLTFSHTTSGTNTMLVVGVSMNITGNTSATVSGITYNGTALTLVGAHNDSANSRRVEIWSLTAPVVGTYNIVASFYLPGGTGTVGAVVGATTFTGADQNQPLRTFVSSDSNGTATAYSMLDIPSSINEYAMDVTATGGAVTISAYTTGDGTVPDTQEWLTKSGTGTNDVSGSSFTHAGTTSIPMAEIFSASSNWAVAGISVKPVQADVGVTVTSTSSTYPGNLTYLVTVTNYGPTTAQGVTLTDTLSATGLTSVLISSSQATCSGSYPSYTCSIGTLALGQSAQISLTATPSASGSYTNTASVAATSPPDLNTLNNSAMAIANAVAITCTPPASLSAGGTLTGVINTYYPGSGSANAGATSITVGALSSGGSATTITKGDLLLVIQMQGASINSTDSSNYGNGGNGAGFTNLNNTGNFEYVTAAANFTSTTGGSISISGAGPSGGLTFSYTASAATASQGQFTFQVVRVPQYSSATLSSGLTAQAWNGSTGGILAVDVAGALTLGSATVSVNGLGFRGAAGMQLTGATTGSGSDFVNTSPTAYTGAVGGVAGMHGSKGEGFAGTPAWVNTGSTFLQTGTDYPDSVSGAANGGMARGAPGSGGGGGTDADPKANDENSGGGGGGNGGNGGGGGDSWNSTLGVGGLGGSAFPANINHVVLGGGGGAGTRNNSDGDNEASSGSAGGGIVMIRAGSLSGSATITANGLASYIGTSNDAGGGAGAGGSIIVLSSSGGESGLTITAQGGRGGDAWDSEPFALVNRHGPGGGGGGGVVLLSGAAASASVSPGANGTTLTPGVPYGSTYGLPGIYVFNASQGQSSVSPGGLLCLPDLTIAKSHSGAFVKGSTGSYNVVVSNVSAYGSTSGMVTMSDTLPTGLTPTGASGTNWTCPAPSGQTVTCTRSDVLGPAASYPAITVTASVSSSATSPVTNTATVSGGGEYNTANDSASDVTNLVSSGTSADLAISTTATSGTWVLAGNNITLVQTITNNGPSATDVIFTETTPANTTFQYVIAPAGWTCVTPAVGASGTISCTYPSLALNGQASITLALNTSPAITNGTYITTAASVGASTTYDTNLTNNTSSVVTIVNTGVNLTVTNTGTPSPVVTGGQITYTQTVTNNGPSTAPNVVFTETIPPNSTFASLTSIPAGWSCSLPTVGSTGTTISCNVSSMAPGNAVIFPVVLNATGAGGTAVTDTAQAWPTPTNLETSPGDNSATSTINIGAANQLDLGVAITPPTGPVAPGTAITYTTTVTNYGAATATNATLTIPTPANTTKVTLTGPTGWTCATTCTLTGTMAEGATATFTLNVTVNAGDTPGATITDTATIATTQTDTNSANNTATVTNTVGAVADLAMTNTPSVSAQIPGSNITYTQVLTNNGPNAITANTANGVTYTVTIQIPTGLQFRSMAAVTNWTCTTLTAGTVGPATITCTLNSGDSVALNGTVTFSPVLQVNAGVANGTIIGETVSIASCSSAACSDPVPSNNSATANITVETVNTEADLAVTNTPSVTQVHAGDPITYTQVVTNNGLGNSGTTVTFTEPIPTNTTFLSVA